MITTLIIDDNKIIREYFQTMINWEEQGFDLVGIASNGITGWQEFNEHLPQLVITDVQMPGMTGLELARMIKETAPDTVIVFISNYEDFNYVRGAMDLGAYDYILKHETRGEKFEKKLERIRNHFKKLSLNNRRYLESKLILAFSSIGTPQLSQIFPARYNLIIFEQESLLPPFTKLSGMELSEVDDEVYQTFFSKYPGSLVCGIRIQKYRYVVLLKAQCDSLDFARCLCSEIYNKTMQRCYALNIIDDQPIELCLSKYKANAELLNKKYFSKHDSIIDINNSYTNYFDIDTELLISTLNQNDIDKTCEIIDTHAYLITKSKNHEQLCLFVTILLDFIKQNSNNLPESSFVFYNNNDLKFWSNADEILFWLKNKLIQLMTSINRSPVYKCSSPVKKAIEYIKAHYSDTSLSVGDISKYVGIDSNRLNKMIKDETGLTIVKWITSVRIEKAKELLTQDKKLTQIYSDIGYTNLSYFSNVFKKVCGVTPLEYRRNSFEKKN